MEGDAFNGKGMHLMSAIIDYHSGQGTSCTQPQSSAVLGKDQLCRKFLMVSGVVFDYFTRCPKYKDPGVRKLLRSSTPAHLP